MPNPNFDVTLPIGQEWEKQFLGIMSGEQVECKLDRRARETGHFFVEFRCRGKDSGIKTTEATWWAFGIQNKDKDVETFVIASVPWLQAQLDKGYAIILGGDDKKSEGILIPIGRFLNR